MKQEFKKIPIVKVTSRPEKSGTYECIVNNWWAVTEDDCVLLYGCTKSRQCNLSKTIIDHNDHIGFVPGDEGGSVAYRVHAAPMRGILPMSKTGGWIVVRDSDFQVLCRRCGATELPPQMPISVDDFVKWSKTFTDKHMNCEEKGPNGRL